MKTNQKHNWIKVLMMSIAIMIFQILYYQLTVIIIQALCKGVLQGVLNGYCLMVHHTIQFGIVFIPCIIIHKKGILDLGFHIKDWKNGLCYLVYALIFELVLNIITSIAWCGNGFTIDNFLFQLFFSGLGEEIIFRSIPLALLPIAYGKIIEININNSFIKKFKSCSQEGIILDIGILISAILFAIGHISIDFSTGDISFSAIQLISALGMGLFLGYAYKKTNSVWFCMAMHSIVNAFIVLFSGLVSLI